MISSANKKKSLDEWLPITWNRNAKWWNSAFHILDGQKKMMTDSHNWTCYSTIAWVAAVEKGQQEGVDYGYRASTASKVVFNFLSALGDVAFAFAGHNVVLEIQATIPSVPEKPSKKPINAVDDNILITLERPRWLIVAANMFVVIHAIGGYQLPCIIWLVICKPKRFSLSWITNWICIVLGVMLMILAPIGGPRTIILSAKDNHFFS
uniref:Lysine histidine transporter 1-like n=1 Tax=Elaeis guineensis var. tenera TaxID=51953 RepID=A0A6I9QRD9_ELAGV|nr:lysine histidine transporter 1-like [Elaeis guineensis]